MAAQFSASFLPAADWPDSPYSPFGNETAYGWGFGFGIGAGWSDGDILLFEWNFDFESEGDATFRGYFGPSWYHYFDTRLPWYSNIAAGVLRGVYESGGENGIGPYVTIGSGVEPIKHVQIGARFLLGHISWDAANATHTAVSLVATVMMY
jgi:hypothetical protein